MLFEDFIKIVFKENKVEINQETEKIISESYEFLKEFSKDKIIYGVNTGFGPMAQYRIEDKDRLSLQYNLIRSHSAGMGDYFSPEEVRAMILCSLNTLSLGKSGVHPSLIHLMKELINREITPLIFKHGGVGASGDLVQLAHLALVLIGEGEVFYNGKRRSTQEVFLQEGIEPIKIHLREGIAVMNGTSVMTGIASLNVHYVTILLEWIVKLSCAINELVQSYDDHFSVELNKAKKYYGQQVIAQKMQSYLSDSKLIRKRSEHLYNGGHTETVFKDKVQEYYSLRCLPQILGVVYDTLQRAKKC